MRVKVFKVDLLIVDHDGLGEEGIRGVLERTKYPNYCIGPVVTSVETAEVDWHDGHPLNHSDTFEAAYRELFGGELASERWPTCKRGWCWEPVAAWDTEGTVPIDTGLCDKHHDEENPQRWEEAAELGENPDTPKGST